MEKIFYFLAWIVQACVMYEASVTVKTWQYWVILMCSAAIALLRPATWED